MRLIRCVAVAMFLLMLLPSLSNGEFARLAVNEKLPSETDERVHRRLSKFWSQKSAQARRSTHDFEPDLSSDLPMGAEALR